MRRSALRTDKGAPFALSIDAHARPCTASNRCCIRRAAASPRAPACHDRYRPTRNAGHRLRRLGLPRPPRGARAGASAATASASRCAGRTSPATCSRSAGSARSMPCRPTCAIRTRSRPRCATPTSWSIWSASCSSAAGSASTPCRPTAPSRWRAPPPAAGARMVHVSALGADEDSPVALCAHQGRRARSAVLAAVPDATILRPSIMFGPEDDFFNRFAALARMSPALPLIGGGATDSSRCSSATSPQAIARAVDGDAQGRHDLRARRAGGADASRS